jgi:hypothetical protein
MTVDELRMLLKDEVAEMVRAPGAPLPSSRGSVLKVMQKW